MPELALSKSQKEAIDKLDKLRVGALFMEPGTGKTRTAIELVESSDADFVLWIVPFQTKQNLQDELDKWGFDKTYEIVGVESLSSSYRIYSKLLNKLKNYERPFVIADESLKIKNSETNRTKAVLELGKHSYYRLILNGTPISKNILDLYTQLEFLSPKILNMDHNEYLDKFCKFTKVNLTNGYTKTEIQGYDNVEYLYSLIEPYVFEARLNLTVGENESSVKCKIKDSERYYELKHDLLERFAGYASETQLLGTFQLMQQSYSLDDGKLKCLHKLMSKFDEEKVIIFVKFIKTRERLQKLYSKSLILTYGKGSFGLNLQQYKTMIFYDKIWNFAMLEQAKRRIYRIGQSEDVTYHYISSDLGLDTMMDRNIKTKGVLLKEFKAASKHLQQKQLEKLLQNRRKIL